MEKDNYSIKYSVNYLNNNTKLLDGDINLENKKTINKSELCFNLSLLNFVYYVNYFPKLQNENINRLKYFFNSLYNSNINIKKINITEADNEEIQYILSKMFLNSSHSDEGEFYKKTLLSILVVLCSYKMIGNFISKKNIFTPKIETKINNFTVKFVQYFNKEINKKTSYNNYNMLEIIQLIKNVLNKTYFNILKQRQDFRHGYKIFPEYGNSVREFKVFASLENIKSLRNKIANNEFAYNYEKNFVADCGEFLGLFCDLKIDEL